MLNKRLERNGGSKKPSRSNWREPHTNALKRKDKEIVPILLYITMWSCALGLAASMGASLPPRRTKMSGIADV